MNRIFYLEVIMKFISFKNKFPDEDKIVLVRFKKPYLFNTITFYYEILKSSEINYEVVVERSAVGWMYIETWINLVLIVMNYAKALPLFITRKMMSGRRLVKVIFPLLISLFLRGNSKEQFGLTNPRFEPISMKSLKM